MQTVPYLSYIIPSRNDEFGIQNIGMLQVSIDGLLEQFDRYGLDAELIFLEWNPVAGVPRIAERIRWPRSERCSIRTIEVPREFHARFADSDKLGFYGACALNCGTRRARGLFILPGSVDHLFSESLIAFIAEKRLEKNAVYRLGLSYVPRDALNEKTLADRLAYCASHVVKTDSPELPPKAGWPPILGGAAGDFELMSRECWWKLRGYREAEISSRHVDIFLLYAAYGADIPQIVLAPPYYLFHVQHLAREHRQEWRRERTWLEALIEWMPLPRKLRERIYDTAVFQFYHNKYSRQWVNGICVGTRSEWWDLEEALWKKKIHYALNGESWGLGSEDLPEKIVHRAAWDKEEGETLTALGSS